MPDVSGNAAMYPKIARLAIVAGVFGEKGGIWGNTPVMWIRVLSPVSGQGRGTAWPFHGEAYWTTLKRLTSILTGLVRLVSTLPQISTVVSEPT